MADDTSPAAMVIASVSHLPESAWLPWARTVGARLSDEPQGGSFPAYKGPVILVFDGVEAALAEAMSRGTLPSAALSAWEAQAGAILAYWRQRRRLTFLLEAGALLSDPGAAARAIAEWRGNPPAGEASELKLQEPDAASPELVALASLPRLSRRSTRKLCDELAAGGLSRAPDAASLLDAAHNARSRSASAFADMSATLKATEEALALTRAKQGGRIAELTSALAVAEEALTSSRTAMDARTAELTAAVSATEEALKLTRTDLGDKVANLTAALTAAREALDQARSEREATVADLTAALAAARDSLDQAQREREATVADLAAAREALDQAQREREAIVADLTAALTAAREALGQVQGERDATVADLAATRDSLDQAQSERQATVADLTTALAAAREALAQVQGEKEATAAELKAALAGREALLNENTRSGERIAELDAALAVARLRLEASQKHFDEASSRLASAEVAGQEGELRRLQLLSLQEMLESVQKKHAAEARKQADRLSARELEVLQLRALLQDRDQTVVALSEERRLLSLGVDERSEEIQVLMNSHSWRLTAPLRATRRILSGSRSGT